MIYFTSDTHFFHENILKLDNRPFKDMNDMCDKMLEKWNNKVNKNDTVYILGDYTWKQSDEHIEYLKKLNGRKRLILGNHDFRNSSNKYKDLFESIKDYDEVKIDGKVIVMSHYPIFMYNKHYHDTIMLYGHLHNTKEYRLVNDMMTRLDNIDCPHNMFNVGCMLWNYEPISLDEIIKSQLSLHE